MSSLHFAIFEINIFKTVYRLKKLWCDIAKKGLAMCKRVPYTLELRLDEIVAKC